MGAVCDRREKNRDRESRSGIHRTQNRGAGPKMRPRGRARKEEYSYAGINKSIGIFVFNG
jgi:hypothetical protein